MNKYPQATDQNGKAFAFLTTADLLAILHAMGKIDDATLEAAREKLRRGGVGLMPTNPDEILRAATKSSWQFGPNAELQAIRDSIHLPLARRVVQLPNERIWLRNVAISLAGAARGAWKLPDSEDAERAASYLFDLVPDPFACSSADESPDRDAWIIEVIEIHALGSSLYF